MKTLVHLTLLLASTILFAQSNTEVYLSDIVKSNEKIELTNLKNISNNKGYDNQPSFYDNNTILFSSTRNTQTDIKIYNIKREDNSWITNTSFGSEYSPLKIPQENGISAIRLDDNGLQRLYKYDLSNGESTVLIKDLKVGYHSWYNKKILVSSVLVEGSMDLVVSNLIKNTNQTAHKNVGRSLHKIPNSNLISFISNENKISTIKSLNPITGDIKTIKSLPIQISDMCWLSQNIALIPNGKIIAQLNTVTDSLSVLHNFTEDQINEISRIAVSDDGKHLAFVSEESPKIIVQSQIEAFNKGDLNTFVSCFSKDVVVRNFSNDTLYSGRTKLKTAYNELFSNNPKAKIKVVKRITKRNMVIDEHIIEINGKETHKGVLYETKNGKITSLTSIEENEKLSDAETVVQRQLDAFNAKDIHAFAHVFSDDIKASYFPNDLYVNGQKQLRDLFSQFFAQTPDLHCEIKNRIIIGNKVIDDEFLTVNAENFTAIAIYEIAHGKIVKMTTIR